MWFIITGMLCVKAVAVLFSCYHCVEHTQCSSQAPTQRSWMALVPVNLEAKQWTHHDRTIYHWMCHFGSHWFPLTYVVVFHLAGKWPCSYFPVAVVAWGTVAAYWGMVPNILSPHWSEWGHIPCMSHSIPDINLESCPFQVHKWHGDLQCSIWCYGYSPCKWCGMLSHLWTATCSVQQHLLTSDACRLDCHAAHLRWLSYIKLPNVLTTYAVDECHTTSCLIFTTFLFYPSQSRWNCIFRSDARYLGNIVQQKSYRWSTHLSKITGPNHMKIKTVYEICQWKQRKHNSKTSYLCSYTVPFAIIYIILFQSH